jgi:AbrB family looped-hinge helix DNA binding protein
MIRGNIRTMKTTMDRAGRLVLPKAIRREARIEAGAQLEVRVRDGRIEIEPAPLEVTIVKRGGLTVAVPRSPVPPMTAAVVAETLDSVRRRGSRD